MPAKAASSQAALGWRCRKAYSQGWQSTTGVARELCQDWETGVPACGPRCSQPGSDVLREQVAAHRPLKDSIQSWHGITFSTFPWLSCHKPAPVSKPTSEWGSDKEYAAIFCHHILTYVPSYQRGMICLLTRETVSKNCCGVYSLFFWLVKYGLCMLFPVNPYKHSCEEDMISLISQKTKLQLREGVWLDWGHTESGVVEPGFWSQKGFSPWGILVWGKCRKERWGTPLTLFLWSHYSSKGSHSLLCCRKHQGCFTLLSFCFPSCLLGVCADLVLLQLAGAGVRITLVFTEESQEGERGEIRFHKLCWFTRDPHLRWVLIVPSRWYLLVKQHSCVFTLFEI